MNYNHINPSDILVSLESDTELKCVYRVCVLLSYEAQPKWISLHILFNLITFHLWKW